MSEDHIILDRLATIRRHLRRNKTDDEFDPLVVEYRQLVCRLWSTPLTWDKGKRDPTLETKGARFRARGTAAERMANRLTFGR